MLRIVSIVGVVAIHTFSLVITNPANAGSPQRLVAIVLDLGFVWAVPVFVMLSGVLVLRPGSFAGGTAAYYRKRALRIVPALVAWHLIYFFVVRLWLQDERPSLQTFATMVVDGKVYTQLYFLWIILGLYLVAPVIAAFINAGSPRRPAIFAAVALVWCVLVFATPPVTAALGLPRPFAVTILTLWIPYVGYFTMGYALGRARIGRLAIAIAGLVAALTIAFTVVQYAAPGRFGWVDVLSPVSYYAPIVTIMSVAVFVFMVGAFDRVRFGPRSERVVSTLSNATFGVFLVHLLVLAVIRAVAPELANGAALWRTAVLFVVVTVVSFAISVGAARVPYLRRIF